MVNIRKTKCMVKGIGLKLIKRIMSKSVKVFGKLARERNGRMISQPKNLVSKQKSISNSRKRKIPSKGK